MTQPPRPVIGESPYSPKPHRTGAWVLLPDGWAYTARPEGYRQAPEDQQRFPFWQTPAHLQAGDESEAKAEFEAKPE